MLSSTVLARPSVALPSLMQGWGDCRGSWRFPRCWEILQWKRPGSCHDGLSLEGPAWKQEAVLSLPGKPWTLPPDCLLRSPFLCDLSQRTASPARNQVGKVWNCAKV